MNSLSRPDIILASTSAYRRQLLERLQLPFRALPPGVEERRLAGEKTDALALRLAEEKALAISRQYPDAVVLGSDQTASVDGELLEKPGSAARAEQQLLLCSGRQLSFYTAVSLASGGETRGTRVVTTEVAFRALSAAEISEYVRRDQPFDCAGSFRWEGLGICLFRSLRSDDPTALEGLPLIATRVLLQDQGIRAL